MCRQAPNAQRIASIGPPRERGGKSMETEGIRAGDPLQLGHPANGVESRRWLSHCDHRRPGFNWATPRTGWKAYRPASSATPFLPLQLGHPANGVERGRRRRRRPVRAGCFNWATPRTGWKVHLARDRVASIPAASIGPPRERGGKSEGRGKCPSTMRRASIGPPRERGGKFPHTTLEPATGAVGFNWATPRTGWKDVPLDLPT